MNETGRITSHRRRGCLRTTVPVSLSGMGWMHLVWFSRMRSMIFVMAFMSISRLPRRSLQ